MGPARSVSRAAAALVALAALSVSDLGRAETEQGQIASLKAELAATKSELARTQSALETLERKVDALGGASAAVSPAQAAPQADITARLAPVNADNPAVSFVVDVQGASNTAGDDGVGFLLGTGELFISAPIDPFLRGYVSINGTTEEDFNIEEAALVTTALPWNLTLKGGRFFADFGRFSHWHDEALPFVDRPPSIDRLIGGESGAEGIEGSWLAPIDQFVQVSFGAYNSIGNERREDPDEFGSLSGQRSWSELTYLARPVTYVDLTDTLNLELGASTVLVPTDWRRALYGVDLTVRHQPGTSELYQGTVFGTEWLWNSERFQGIDDAGRFRRQGGYTYFESFFGRRFSGGLRFDYAEQPFGDAERQRTYSGFVTWQPSEFQRLRFQIDQIDVNGPNDQRFTLQWTAFIGSHSHGFASR
jgi:hypothetical protein